MTVIDSTTEHYQMPIQLLDAIQQYNLTNVLEILRRGLADTDLINTRCGALQITPLQLSCSLPADKSLPLVKLLISHGANVAISDKLGRTPLHYACTNGCVELVQLLLNNGSVIDAKYGVNSLLKTVPVCDDLGISKCLSLPECWGRTPLHQAVKGNHKEIVKLLLDRGASVDIQDENGVSPLLLAGAGVDDTTLKNYEEIIHLLITHHADVNLYSNFVGTTALHHSVALNSYEATKSLLKAGAQIKEGACGQTPLHEAASKSNYVILALLLRHENKSVNRPDHDGRTALHKAAFAGARDCIKLLIDHGGDLSMETKTKISVMDAVFSHVPRPLPLLHDIFNTKIICNDLSVNDVDFKVCLDFTVLSPRGKDKQMSVIAAILQAGNDHQAQELLQHPLLETYLHVKWNKLRIFFTLLVVIHIIFVLSLSTYVMLIVHQPSWSDFSIAFSRNLLLLSAVSLFTHSIIQCILVPRHYFRQYEMWLNLFCAFCAFIVAIFGNETISKSSNSTPAHWILHTSSIIILIAWIELMLLIGRFPAYGYYALMFSAVLQNVLKVLFTFICLVIGFALSFSIQFHAYEQFQDPWRALVKTTVMMMGEFEYADLFADASTSTGESIRLPATSRVIFIIFIILASIVLMNLMVGLAVSDIQGLQREGHGKQLAKQAMFLSHLEIVLSQKVLKSDWFPYELYKFLYFKRCVDINLVLKPSMNTSGVMKRMPLQLFEAVVGVAIKNLSFTCLSDNTVDNQSIMTMLKQLEDQIREIKTSLADIQGNYNNR